MEFSCLIAVPFVATAIFGRATICDSFFLRLSVELSTGNVVTDHMVVAVGVETDDTLALNSGLQVRQTTP